MRNLPRHLLLFGLLTAVLVSCPTQNVFATVSNLTVSTTTALGDGATTSFNIGFDFRSNSWLNVVRHDNADGSNTTISQGAGASKYTVSGGNPGTAIVMGTAPSITQYLVITRSIPLTQPVVFNAASIFPYAGLSAQVDQMTLELQNLNANIGGNGGGGGGGGGGVSLPVGVANNLLGWNGGGASVVNIPNASLTTNTFPLWNGSSWTQQSFTGAGLVSLINGAATPITGGSGGTGVSNSGTLTWNHNLQFTLTADSNLTLPTSGTLIAGTADNNNTVSTIVKRDSSGNFASNVITANSFVGALTGSVTGNITGNVSGTAANVTGTVAIGHGGTGQTTQQAAINALTGTQSAGKFLRSDGVNATLQVLSIGDVPQGFSRQKLAQDTANTIVTNDGSGNLSVLTGVLAGNVPIFDGVKWTVGPQGTGIPGIFPYGADTGAANVYIVLTPSPPVLSYAPGVGISFLASNTNTGAATINVQGLGVQTIKRADGADLNAGDIIANQMAILEYDGTNFQLINPYEPEKMNASTFAASATGNTTTTQFIANCSSACALTLPLISTIKKTVPVYFKSINTGVVTINASGSDTIDGASSAVVNFQWTALTLNPTSSGWVIQ